MRRRRSPTRVLIALALSLAAAVATGRAGGDDSATGQDAPIVDPVLSARWPATMRTALLIRDRLRTLVGQWNEDNLRFENDASLFESMRRLGPRASASCGPMSLAYERALQLQGIRSRRVAILAVDVAARRVTGHTANEVCVPPGRWVLVDAHVGVVWQRPTGELVSALSVAGRLRQAPPWDVYPSTHGLAAAYSPGFGRHVLEAMSLSDVTGGGNTMLAVAYLEPTGERNDLAVGRIVLLADDRAGAPGADAASRILERKYPQHAGLEIVAPDAVLSDSVHGRCRPE